MKVVWGAEGAREWLRSTPGTGLCICGFSLAMLLELKRELEALVASQPQREMRVLSSRVPGKLDFQGKTLLDFTNWDYLNLSQHERVKRAMQEEIEQHGSCAASARVSSGTFPSHLAAEHRLAQYFGCESALLFSSRNQAYFSLLTGLCGERDAIVADEQLQAPVGDAAYLVNASFGSFQSSSLSSLGRELERVRGARRKLVLLESLQSQSGDVISLAPIAELASAHGASLVLDESSAVPVLGPRGAGGFDRERAALSGKILCQITELAGLGAAPLASLSGTAVLVSSLIQRSRTFGVECAVSPAAAAGVVAASNAAEMMLGARLALGSRAGRVREVVVSHEKRIATAGSAVVLGSGSAQTESPIVTIPCPTVSRAREIFLALLAKGILSDSVQTKGLLSESANVRLIMNSGHVDSDIERLVNALAEILAKVSVS